MKPKNLSICHLHEGLYRPVPILPPEGSRAWAVIDTRALADNYRTLVSRVRAASPATQPMAVVKADAYGHGIRPVVTTLVREGCRAFAVACVQEAVPLRGLLDELLPHEKKPMILVLGYVSPTCLSLLARQDITVAVVSDAHAEALAEAALAAGVTVKVHIALDTGMNRLGYPAHTDGEIAETVSAILARFDSAAHLIPDGIFTHFARADEDYDTEILSEDSLTRRQYDRFRAVLGGLAARGFVPRLAHICNSAASVRLPGALPCACHDAVRLGIELYGYGVPSPDGDPTVRPVMRLETTVAHIHGLLPGETVGYGGTYSSDTPRTLITLPIGYADGWIRFFTGTQVLIHTPVGDHLAPIVGRICMDQCMADVTNLPPAARDAIVCGKTRVTLFGSPETPLDHLADLAHTISYELLCLITARVPRVWEDGGNEGNDHLF